MTVPTISTRATLRTASIVLILLIVPFTSQASPTDHPTIQVWYDLLAQRSDAEAMVTATFQVAESQGADLTVTLFDSEVSGTWYPPKPLGLADFHVGLAQYIKGGAERARQHEAAERLNLALASFQEYLQKATPAAEGCSKLLNVAQSTASASAGVTVVIVGAKVCTTPRIQLRTQEERRLILLLAPSTAPGHDNGDCALQQTERRLHLWFPNAAILPAGNPTALTQAMGKDRRPAETGQLVVFPCSPHDRRPSADHPVAISAVHQSEEAPPSDAGVRLIVPRPNAHVGRIVVYQGAGVSRARRCWPLYVSAMNSGRRATPWWRRTHRSWEKPSRDAPIVTVESPSSYVSSGLRTYRNFT